MTVTVKIGRRVPRSFMKRVGSKLGGLLNFQENMWQMINQSFAQSKKKAAHSDIDIQTRKEEEVEDMRWKYEWLIVTVNGTRDQEIEEYEEAMQMFEKFRNNRQIKKNIDKSKELDHKLKENFRTRKLSAERLKDIYEKGRNKLSEKSISNSLLDVGIICDVEKDFEYENKGD